MVTFSDEFRRTVILSHLIGRQPPSNASTFLDSCGQDRETGIIHVEMVISPLNKSGKGEKFHALKNNL